VCGYHSRVVTYCHHVEDRRGLLSCGTWRRDAGWWCPPACDCCVGCSGPGPPRPDNRGTLLVLNLLPHLTTESITQPSVRGTDASPKVPTSTCSILYVGGPRAPQGLSGLICVTFGRRSSRDTALYSRRAEIPTATL